MSLICRHTTCHSNVCTHDHSKQIPFRGKGHAIGISGEAQFSDLFSVQISLRNLFPMEDEFSSGTSSGEDDEIIVSGD